MKIKVLRGYMKNGEAVFPGTDKKPNVVDESPGLARQLIAMGKAEAIDPDAGPAGPMTQAKAAGAP